MRIINMYSQFAVFGSLLFLNQTIFAQQNHADEYDHRKEHGAQIHAITTFDNKWLVDKDGKGLLETEFESSIGSDENKLFITGKLKKSESDKPDYNFKMLYSLMISDFWDAQVGTRYRVEKFDTTSNATDTEEKLDAVIGLRGLVPYFFETEAYFYVGEDSYTGFSLETERDFLFTQKFIVQPYLDLELVFNDDSKYAKKSGLSDLSVGIESRYEITKKVMPYIDIAYKYDKGIKESPWRVARNSDKDWLYGAGIRFRF